eukprot:TRINITY_DN25009_c0_g1_i1.p1 TRINITY_DN25009_c0_g1~~TRINITY_DN25009_c0_g1_i1.p1  ORF type:complete len:491 (+),score=117.21 TRINITY_DN25009_c0_g1_i1:34-1506(+)
MAASPIAKEAEVPMEATVRVINRRMQGESLYFFDCYRMHNGECEMLGVMAHNNQERFDTDIRHVKVGDVLRVSGVVDTKFTQPKPPRKFLLRVSNIKVVEPWRNMTDSEDASKKFTWRMPTDLKTSSKCRPVALLQCVSAVNDRLCSYFDSTAATENSKARFIFIYDTPEAPNAPWRQLIACKTPADTPHFLHGALQKVFPVNQSAPVLSFADAVQVLKAHIVQQGTRQFNIITYPKALEARVRSALPMDTLATGTDDTYENHYLCYADGLFWLGLSERRVIIPSPLMKVVPSGAYWKLNEIIERYLGVMGRVEAYTGRDWAIDVGASPGGWSYSCAKDLGTKKVLAVDPAATMSPMLKEYGLQDVGLGDGNMLKAYASENPKIFQLQARGEPALQELVIPSKLPIAIYVCDMNVPHAHTVDLARSVYDSGLFERPALVVLTFKNTLRSKPQFAEITSASVESLSWLSNIREIHLFANTQLETTIVGEVL